MSDSSHQLESIKVGYLPSLSPTTLRKRKDMVADRTYSFEIAPDPIPSGGIKKYFDADVVVVGAGVAGLSAAISAAQAGARTILLEKLRRSRPAVTIMPSLAAGFRKSWESKLIKTK